MTITSDAANVFRDNTSPGSTTPHEPVKSEIRSLFATVDGEIQNALALGAGGQIGFTTKALMDADLAHGVGTIAVVFEDTTPANNGTYLKVGASGTGSWDQVSSVTLTSVVADMAALSAEVDAVDALFDPFENVSRALRVGLGGDSIIQDNNRGDSGGDLIQTRANGEIAAALALNPRLEFTNWPDITRSANSTLYFNGANQGVNADRTDQLLARIGALTSQALDIAIIAIGVNDILQNIDAATAFANIQAIVRALTYRGVRVVLFNMRPVAVATLPNPSTARTEYIALQALIEGFWDTEPLVIGHDIHSVYESGGGVPGGTPTTALYYDDVHPNDLGAWTAAPGINTTLDGLVKDIDAYPVVRLSDNLWPNGDFSASGGTASTGVAGTVAGSWRALRVGSSPTVVASLVANAETGGNSQRLVITPSGVAPTDAVWFQLAADTIDVTSLVGQWVYGWAKVRLSDWAYWRAIQFNIAKDASVPVMGGNMYRSATASQLPSTGLDGGLLIPIGPYEVEVGVTVLVPVLDIRTVGNGTGTGTVDIDQLALIVGPDPRRTAA